MDIAFNVDINNYSGISELQLKIVDMKISRG
jgi:hypothetical protein